MRSSTGRVGQPAMRWRMARASTTAWGRMRRIERDRPGYVQAVLDEVRDRGALAASDLTDGGKAVGPWWGWAAGKTALEWLFYAGAVTSAGRRRSFERVYDLPERVLPAWPSGATCGPTSATHSLRCAVDPGDLTSRVREQGADCDVGHVP